MSSYAILNQSGSLKQLVSLQNLPPHKAGMVVPLIKTDAPAVLWNQKTYVTGYEVHSTGVFEQWGIFPKTDSEIYVDKRNEGYFDPIFTGIRLKTTDNAQHTFASQMTLIQVALQAGVLSMSDNLSIWDFNENECVLPVSGYFSLMLRYGMYCQTIYSLYAP